MRINRSLIAILTTILIASVPLAAPAQLSVGIGFNVGAAPPPLPVYTQPAAPYSNYQWTPGYWGWGSAGYYWVPGVWVAPPSVGVLWTPGYWGYSNGYYGWNGGYWGASVGFYGGINYGFGYPGTGFYGGAWNGGRFNYNTAYVNVNRTVIHNTYNRTVVNNGNVCNNCKNVSYNGGKGGINARPTQSQIQARQSGRAPTTAQKNQANIAGQDRNQLASVNHGKPSLTASNKPFDTTNKPSDFAPVTGADKASAAKIPTRGNSVGNTNGSNQPANSMQSKPSNSMQSKPNNSMQSKPNNSMQSQNGNHPSGQQYRPPQQHPKSTTQSQYHPQTQQHHPSSTNKPQGSMQGQRPPGSGGGSRPPQGNGQRPPDSSGQGKPPRS